MSTKQLMQIDDWNVFAREQQCRDVAARARSGAGGELRFELAGQLTS
jgi:hypothetical protein